MIFTSGEPKTKQAAQTVDVSGADIIHEYEPPQEQSCCQEIRRT
jgi:hypothetical protein